MNLILLDTGEVSPSSDVTLSDARATHLRRVLKVTPGQRVRVGVLDGPLGTGVVTSVADPHVTMRCAFEAQTPDPPAVDLLLALPRPKVMRRLWAQLAALGVRRIILTNAGRVERNYFDTHVLSPEYYRPLLVEGLQQARDTRLPVVSIHRQFRVLVEDHLETLVGGAESPTGGSRRTRPTCLVADPGAHTSVRAALGSSGVERVVLAVGPEGGWNRFELSSLESHGFERISMGPRTLRTDTACIALLGIVHDALRTLQA